jgi:Alkylmercury lyase
VSVNAEAAGPDRLAPAVAAVLAAAGIPPRKLGRARSARLSEAQRELYFWILRRFATAGRPGIGDVLAAADRLGLDAKDALQKLSREDLVHHDADGAITVAYPFSGLRTQHRVRFPSGHEVDAMCAIDALGIASMLEEPIEIESRDPVSGDEVRARVASDGAAEWWPESAVVVAGAILSQDEACCGCCPVLNFFAATANAERWLAEHSEVRGIPVSVEDAAAAGRAIFGGVLAVA